MPDVFLKKFKRITITLITQLIARFPFWDTISTMMLFAEVERKTGKINIPYFIAYADAAFLIILGTFMSFKPSSRSTCALASAVQALVKCILHIMVYGSLRHDIFFHIAVRNVGVAASYLLLAYGFGAFKAKRSSLLQAAYFLFGLILFTQAVLILTSDFEQKFITYFLPRQLHNIIGNVLLLPFLIFCLAVSAISLVTRGKGFAQARRFAFIFWLLICVPGDIGAVNWFALVEHWTYYRLVASSLCTLVSLIGMVVADI